MRKSNWPPSIMPNGDDQNVYLVVDDFGRHGRAWREVDTEQTDLETVIRDLLEGQYNSPVRVVSFNTTERWSQDVSGDIAAGDATCKCAKFRPASRISLSSMPTAIADSCRCHYA